MNKFLLTLVILELVIDIFWSIQYYKLKQENIGLKVCNALLKKRSDGNDI